MQLRLPMPAARWGRLFAFSALVGACAGLAAAGLEWGLHHGSELLAGRFTHLGGSDVLQFRWGVLLLPAMGGLASGLAIHFLCRGATGHGTDLLTRAFHRDMGELKLKAPLVKAAASVGVISCGGSAGPEGPIAALGAAIGSSFGRLWGLTARERRILLVAGCAAGVGAIFRCPLGGALFAAGILYSEPEFEAESIVPGFVASVMGYSVFMSFWGFGEPLIRQAETLVFRSVAELIPYAMLGLLCGLMAIFFSVCVRTVEHQLVGRSGLPRWLAPAFGGLATGGLACLLPQVMDGRYIFVQAAVDGSLFGEAAINWWWWTGLFAAVALVKCLATALTVGSGGSGGLLGPSVFIGGAVGAFLGALIEALVPGDVFPEPLRESLIPVGMGGVLAATMRTPLAAIVMVTEMTGSYGLIVPSMLVCVSSYVVGRRWGLNEEQVRTGADSPAHAADMLIHLLESWRVDQLMERDWPATVKPNASLGEMVRLIQAGTRPVFAVCADGKLLGLVSVTDIRQIMEEPGLAEAVIAADMMTSDLLTAFPDEDVYSAISNLEMGHHDVLPVVSRDDSANWLGMLTREAIFDALRRQTAAMHEHVLEEHVGLAVIEQEGKLQALAMGVVPQPKELIQRLFVPLDAIGKSLRETDFRREFGIQVIAIENADGALQCPPDPDQPLQTSQRIVAIVPPEETAEG